jgi:hypothetical protein
MIQEFTPGRASGVKIVTKTMNKNSWELSNPHEYGKTDVKTMMMMMIMIKSLKTKTIIVSLQVKEAALSKLKHLKTDVSRTAGLESDLHLALGARIMLRRNLDIEQGLVNGSMGEIREFIHDVKGHVKELTIQFDNGILTNISRQKIPFELMRGVYVHREQFAVSLSYAVTIHKCQGLSLDCAIIDLGRSIFGPAMAYVALSRVRSITGLHLIDLCINKITADTKAIKEYNRLRSTYRPDLAQIQIPEQPAKQPYIYTATSLGEMNKNTSKNTSKNTNKNTNKNTSKNTSNNTSNNTSIQPQQSSAEPAPLMYGPTFVNTDRVSCYANSVTQLILHIPEFKNAISSSTSCNPFTSPVTHQLQHLINEHSKRTSGATLNVTSLRQAVGQTYAVQRQQDCYEFLCDMINKLSNEQSTQLPHLVTGIEGQEQRCSLNHTHDSQITGHDQFTVMRLHFPQTNQNYISFKELTEGWSPFDQQCSICASPLQRRTVIRVAPQYLFVSLCIFQSDTNRIDMPVTGYVANEIVIAKQKYKTVGVVCHSDRTTDSGHYWCLLKDNKQWIEVNDGRVTVRSRFVNNLKNVYLLLLKLVTASEE